MQVQNILLAIAGALMLISAFGHLAVYFAIANAGINPLVFGIIYAACAFVQLKKQNAGSVLTIASVTIGIGLGVYGKLVLGNEPAPLSMFFLAIELICCRVLHSLQSKRQSTHVLLTPPGS
jgi:hypothetical protein